MAREVITKCDICGDDEGARRYTIHTDVEQWSIDLCPTHAEPIMTVARQGQRQDTGTAALPTQSTRSLESRIRGVPDDD